MNYGIPNDKPQPIIAPSSPVPLAERIRPAWLCITAPEHADRGISEKELPDLTYEQIIEAEAEEVRLETIRALKKQALAEERERAKEAKKAANDAAREAVSRARQAARLGKHEPTLGESIRVFRSAHNLTQNEFGAKLGYTRQSIKNWEMDLYKPYPKTLEKIMDFMKE